jgi:hypothetical protein
MPSVRAKAKNGGQIAIISLAPDGGPQIQCDDEQLFEWLRELLAERLFAHAHGCCKMQRGPDGRLLRDPVHGHAILERYVNLSAPPADILAAIEDNLEITDQFVLTRLP